MFPIKKFLTFSMNKEVFIFSDLQEIFDPFRTCVTVVDSRFDVSREIEILNKEIDEALEFYFKSDILDCPKFSWEK